jgi:tetratricopeptide (TPR) repeat protein
MKQTTLIAALFLFSVFQSAAQNEKARTLITEGVDLYDQGKYEDAIGKYKESMNLDSSNIVVYSEMSMTYLALHDFNHTEGLCRRAILKFPGNEILQNIYSNYGNSLDERKEPEQALKIYTEGISKFPAYYMLHFNKGITEYGLKRMYAARTSFQNAIKCNPKHASSYYYLGILEDDFENRIPAVLALSRFLILEPKGERAAKVLPYLTKKVNSLYLHEKVGSSVTTSSSARKRTDTTENSFRGLDASLSIFSTMSSIPGMEKEGQTEVDKFEYTLQEIFELLAPSKKDNSGFYWDYLAPYLTELESKGHMKAFVYFINHYETKDPAVANWPVTNEKAMDAFLAWNKKYKW